MNMSRLDEEPIFFKNEWKEIKITVEVGNTTYYVHAYPLDITECDTIVIRVYSEDNYSDQNEYGNGLWIDSDMGIIEGNDELYFDDDNVEEVVIDRVFEVLKEKEVI